MSWWVSLNNDDKPVTVESYSEGGTYELGGTTEADLNITYNYEIQFLKAWDGVGLKDALNGKKAIEVQAILDFAVKDLGTDTSDNYWDSTPGNAGKALSILAAWASQYPNAIFRVN